jgi:hypothetical protein
MMQDILSSRNFSWRTCIEHSHLLYSFVFSKKTGWKTLNMKGLCEARPAETWCGPSQRNTLCKAGCRSRSAMERGGGTDFWLSRGRLWRDCCIHQKSAIREANTTFVQSKVRTLAYSSSSIYTLVTCTWLSSSVWATCNVLVPDNKLDTLQV